MEASIIYNVTVNVESSIAGSWLQWMLNEHIPDIMASNCFRSYRLVKLLEVDDSEGPTYAAQYFAASKADYNRYLEIFAPELRQRSIDKWSERFVAFRSVMEVISEGSEKE